MQGFGGGWCFGIGEVGGMCVGQCVVLCGSEWRKVGRVKGTPTAVTAVTICNAATIRRQGETTTVMETALSSKDWAVFWNRRSRWQVWGNG